MTQWRLLTNPAVVLTDGASSFVGVIGRSVKSTTESETQSKFYTNYTCTDLRVHLTTADIGGDVTLRDDGVNTSVAVSFTTTGWVEDLTDSVTPAADSLMNFNIVLADNMHGDNATIFSTLLTIEHASINAPMLCGGVGANAITTTKYSNMGTALINVDTKAVGLTKFKRATVLNNLHMLTTSSGGSMDWDVSPAKNDTVSTSVTVNVTGTGAFEDTTGTEVYASGDTASWYFEQNASDSLIIVTIQVDSDTESTWLSTLGITNITSSRRYIPFTGKSDSTTPGDDYLMRIGSVTAANLECYVTNSDPGDISARVGAVNSTNLTVDSSSTGYLEDITGSDSVADDTSLQISCIATSGRLDAAWVGLECPWVDSGEPTAARRVIITSD